MHAAGTATVSSLSEMLSRLYKEDLVRHTTSAYLAEHAAARCVENQVRTFLWYAAHLPGQGTILDWGCQHAPDGCLIRMHFGAAHELHGCDFHAPETYPAFARFAGLHYHQLTHVWRMPYPDGAFDAVIGSGTLEHTALDFASLGELYRVLKPGGLLVITYLPNRLSWGEWLRRNVRKKDFHRRLYGLSEAQGLLKHHGFYPVAATYQSFRPERFLDWLGLPDRHGLPARLADVARRANLFCSTLCLVATRVEHM
jgi:SAM-dependent methyltransferase